MVSSVSLANGGPPPPFPNTLFQTVEAGDPSLTLLLYLWGADSDPLVGADFDYGLIIADPPLQPVGFVATVIFDSVEVKGVELGLVLDANVDGFVISGSDDSPSAVAPAT